MIWVADAKNEVEALGSVLVVERRETASRYLCSKCKYLFWGSKKRVKEHLLNAGQGSRANANIRGCLKPMTAQEKRWLESEPVKLAAEGLATGKRNDSASMKMN